MPLRAFSYPLPETRFLQAGSRLFKFKIRNGSNVRGCEVNDEQVSQEIQDAIRVVLANLDCLQPFATKHFSVFPYKSKWKRVSQLQFQKGFVKLTAYPFLLTLYLETRESSCPRPAAVDGKEARETQGEPVTGAQEGQSHSPKRSTITGDRTSVLIRWACKIFPLSLFCGHKKK